MSLHTMYAVLIGILILWILSSQYRSRRRSQDGRIFWRHPAVPVQPSGISRPAGDTSERECVESLYARLLEEDLDESIRQLPPDESKVIRPYFGIGSNASMSLEEIGRRMGLSKLQVRTIRERAVTRMRYLSRARSRKPDGVLSGDLLKDNPYIFSGMDSVASPYGLKFFLGWLPPLEREAAGRYLGWIGGTAATIGEIAVSLGLSVPEMRRILRRAMVRLRQLVLMFRTGESLLGGRPRTN
jgi:DNA-directed RNA polymerase specialized sigma24 family protein